MPNVRYIEGTKVEMKYVGGWITPEQYEALKIKAAAKKKSMNALLSEYLERIAKTK